MTIPAVSSRLQSARALRSLLENIERNPEVYVESAIRPLLHSQGKLARFSSDELHIRGCSLNTLKRSCVGLEGGYEALDRLRKGALHALERENEHQNAVPKTTKRSLAERVARLSSDLQAAREDLILLSKMLETSLRQGRQYAYDSKSATIIELCRQDQSEIRDMMTLRQTSAGRLKLIKKSHAS